MLCGNCDTELPDAARFCFLCGAPQVPPHGASGAAPAGAGGTACRIRLWRGYVKARFYVEPDDPLASVPFDPYSRPFRWHRADVPPAVRDDVREAYDGLVARLKEHGFEQVGLASPWYAQAFVHREPPLQIVVKESPRARGIGPDASQGAS